MSTRRRLTKKAGPDWLAELREATGEDKPKKFREKPVVIEAERYLPERPSMIDQTGTGIPGVVVAFKNVFNGTISPVDLNEPFDGDWIPVAAIQTLEGWHEVSPGDYVITGVKGERYPCKPDIFEATYEPA